ncbi:MAG TPA: cation:proton antiporter [Candidatus Magasanikbacteria bacterium]|nr:cation:proton antiporter [Candidatus Magasanikbacteria bacterium]
MKKILSAYLILLGALVGTIVISRFSEEFFALFHQSSDEHLLIAFFSISVLCILSFVIYHLSVKTVFPSFVVAIFFGIAAQPLLGGIVGEKSLLNVIVGAGATLILFSGGLETPFENFKKIIWKILSLSFLGLLFTAVVFSFGVHAIGNLVGITVPISVAVLLGAILASTDPAAIIPVLRRLRFQKRATKDLIISESAVTDVTGTLLTLAFIGILAHNSLASISASYTGLFTREVGHILFEEILFGVIFGGIGYLLLNFLSKFTKNGGEESEAHAAYFLFVPIAIFTLAVAFGGSGYLAAFVAGLLFVMSKHLHHTERFFNHTIEGFFKPTIFILLGALVDVDSLIQYAGIGILAAVLFMFVIRPISVLIALGPFSFFGKERFNIRELFFISFVRETGAIPAVLLVTVVSSGISGLDGLVPIGMWVILATLIIEPPLTPWVAKYLKVATPISDKKALHLSRISPFVVLGSRGYSFMDRLPRVAEWASKHHIHSVVLLHCLEDKYTEELAKDIGEQAEVAFKQINEKRSAVGESDIDFEYISRKGFLQDNIDEISRQRSNVTTIFVGRKVLDFRLEDIKKLSVPIFFID